MSNVTTTDITFLTKKELAVRWRVKTRTIENWVRDNKCPLPTKITGKVALWSLEEVVEHEIKCRQKSGMSTD